MQEWQWAELLGLGIFLLSLDNQACGELTYTLLVGNALKKQLAGQPAVEREKTKDALLRVAIAAIEEVGEAHVRLEDILRDADASVSSLYHHYGNMRGLLDEAQLARFDAETGNNIKVFYDAVLRVANKDEFTVLVRNTVEQAFSRSQAHNRSSAVNAFGSIFKTPNVNERVVELERAHIEMLAHAISHARAKGYVRADLDVDGFSAWIMGLTFSRVIPDIMNDEAIVDSWMEMTVESINHLLGL